VSAIIDTNSKSIHQFASQPSASECEDYPSEGEGKCGSTGVFGTGTAQKLTQSEKQHDSAVHYSVPQPNILSSGARWNCKPVDQPKKCGDRTSYKARGYHPKRHLKPKGIPDDETEKIEQGSGTEQAEWEHN
jgi:hypothetical protein